MTRDADMARVILGFVLLFMTAPGAHAQTAVFLDIDGIPGEALQSGFEDQIELLNWSQTVANVGGPPVIMPLQFEHRIDRSTPKLIEAALLNTDLGEVVLSESRLNGPNAVFLTVTLDSARVAAVETRSDPGVAPVEKITLTCSTFTLSYRQQSPQGGLLDPIIVTGNCQ